MVPLQRVHQDHYDGCFVACTAMLLGVTYLEAFKLVHPDRYVDEDGYGRAGVEDMDVPNAAFNILQKLNLNPKRANVQQMRHLRRLAMVLIRWADSPTIMHAIVFDPASKRILDPAYYNPLSMRRYATQMDAAFYVDKAA